MDWGEKRTPPPHPLKVSAGKLLGVCRKNRKGKSQRFGEKPGILPWKKCGFTLWLCQTLLLKMAIYSGFSHWKWWFSIVMLVYQRVIDKHLIVEIREKNVAKQMWFENVWKNRMARPMIVGKNASKQKTVYFLSGIVWTSRVSQDWGPQKDNQMCQWP